MAGLFDEEDAGNAPSPSAFFNAGSNNSRGANASSPSGAQLQGEPEAQPSMEDLFGEDISSEEEGQEMPLGHQVKPEAGEKLGLPPITRTRRGTRLRVCRLPGAVSYIAMGYNADHYSEMEEADALRERNKEHAAESLIRWRFRRNADGSIERDGRGRPKRESNTRFVEWDDGSMTLHVGPTVYEVSSKIVPKEIGFLYRTEHAAHEGSSLPTETVLEAVGRVEDLVQLRPVGDTEHARKVVLETRRRREEEKRRVRQIEVMHDPEREKEKRVQQIDEILRKEEAAISKEEAARRRAAGGARGLSRAELLEEEEGEQGMYEDHDIAALKKAKRVPAFEGLSEEEEEAEEEEEEEEEGGGASSRKRRRSYGRRGGDVPEEERAAALREAMLDEAAEEEEAERRRRRRGRVEESESEEEEDLAAAVRAANVRSARGGGEGAAEESEEDEDDPVVGRPRKRRRTVKDDEDDEDED